MKTRVAYCIDLSLQQKKELEESSPESTAKNSTSRSCDGKLRSCDERQRWDTLVKQLEDILAVNCLLQLPSDSAEFGKVSVQKVMEGGRGTDLKFFSKTASSIKIFLTSAVCRAIT